MHHLVGMAEIAEMLGVSRQRVAQLIGSYEDFPAPEAELTGGRVWARTAVEAWIAAHPDRGPGRPTERLRRIREVVMSQGGSGDAHFGRMTPQARRVIVKAQEEARLFPHDYIGTEHLLLGLLSEEDHAAERALGRLGVDADHVRRRIREIVGVGSAVPSGHIPFTPRTKKVLELSLREALHQGSDRIGPEHILLALIREGEGVGRQILGEFEDGIPAREAVLEAMATRVTQKFRLTLEEATERVSRKRHPNGVCSFCGKHQHEVEKLVAGPGVFICAECIDLCTEIVAQERAKADEPSEPDLLQRIADLEERLRALEDRPDE